MQYISIDLKSFYASVECIEHGFDPLDTNLVVADRSRTEKTICLAVTPSLKSYGISGRARLFEVVQRVKEINSLRLKGAIASGVAKRSDDGVLSLGEKSIYFSEVEADPSLEVSYFVAPPRMKLYEEYSTRIFSIYSRYVSTEDIVVYSIDECFINAEPYLSTYNMTAHQLAMTMIKDVLKETGITATAGIGTNLYLSKVAMDIVAKHAPADRDGVRIAELNEDSYRRLLWNHKPVTDFWRVGRGTARRMAKLGCHTMGDIARLSHVDENVIYKALGRNAELLIDHAWGWEPVDIPTIKSYRPKVNSLSSGQVLMEPYTADKARLIVREMTELMVLDLVKKGLVTKRITLTVGYDRESLVPQGQGRSSSYNIKTTGERFLGEVVADHYGRIIPKHAHGTGNIDRWTSSTKRILDVMMELYDNIIDRDLLIRRVTVAADDIIKEDEIPEEAPRQLDLFTDFEATRRKKDMERIDDEKEKRMQKATLLLQEKFGKNAVLKGMNLQDGAMTISRNSQIGGHSAGE